MEILEGYLKEVTFDLDLERERGFECGQRGELQKDVTKSGPSKHTGTGMCRLYVERYFSRWQAKKWQRLRKAAVEIGQVWDKIMDSLKCKAKEFGMYPVDIEMSFIAQIPLKYILSFPAT